MSKDKQLGDIALDRVTRPLVGQRSRTMAQGRPTAQAALVANTSSSTSRVKFRLI